MEESGSWLQVSGMQRLKIALLSSALVLGCAFAKSMFSFPHILPLAHSPELSRIILLSVLAGSLVVQPVVVWLIRRRRFEVRVWALVGLVVGWVVHGLHLVVRLVEEWSGYSPILMQEFRWLRFTWEGLLVGVVYSVISLAIALVLLRLSLKMFSSAQHSREE